MKGKYVITSESVGKGHPDKVCDQISDAVLDAVLKDDPKGRVACETFISAGLVIVGGEITTTTYIDVHRLVRRVLTDIGYTNQKYGFDASTCAILNTINSQSPDIAQHAADQAMHIDIRFGGDFSADNDQSGRNKCFAGHAASGIIF